jgi:hypothetical protein
MGSKGSISCTFLVLPVSCLLSLCAAQTAWKQYGANDAGTWQVDTVTGTSQLTSRWAANPSALNPQVYQSSSGAIVSNCSTYDAATGTMIATMQNCGASSGLLQGIWDGPQGAVAVYGLQPITAIDAQTGTQLWQAPLQGDIILDCLIVQSRGKLVVLSSTVQVLLLDLATGATLGTVQPSLPFNVLTSLMYLEAANAIVIEGSQFVYKPYPGNSYTELYVATLNASSPNEMSLIASTQITTCAVCNECQCGYDMLVDNKLQLVMYAMVTMNEISFFGINANGSKWNGLTFTVTQPYVWMIAAAPSTNASMSRMLLVTSVESHVAYVNVYAVDYTATGVMFLAWQTTFLPTTLPYVGVVVSGQLAWIWTAKVVIDTSTGIVVVSAADYPPACMWSPISNIPALDGSLLCRRQDGALLSIGAPICTVPSPTAYTSVLPGGTGNQAGACPARTSQFSVSGPGTLGNVSLVSNSVGSSAAALLQAADGTIVALYPDGTVSGFHYPDNQHMWTRMNATAMPGLQGVAAAVSSTTSTLFTVDASAGAVVAIDLTSGCNLWISSPTNAAQLILPEDGTALLLHNGGALDNNTGVTVTTWQAGWLSVFAYADGHVYGAAGSGRDSTCVCVSAVTGVSLWWYSASMPIAAVVPFSAGGLVFAALEGYESFESSVVALDIALGSVVWTVSQSATAMSLDAINKVMLLSLSTGGIYAVDGNTGLPLWEYVSTIPAAFSPAIDTAARAFTTCGAGANLVVFDTSTGVVAWSLALAAPICSPGLLTQNGVLVFTTASGDLMIITPPAPNNNGNTPSSVTIGIYAGSACGGALLVGACVLLLWRRQHKGNHSIQGATASLAPPNSDTEEPLLNTANMAAN